MNNNEELDRSEELNNLENEQPAEADVVMDQTQSVSVEPVGQPVQTRKRKRGGLWILGGIFFLLIALVLGVWSGYQRGVARRLEAKEASLLTEAEQQLSLAYEDINQKRLETARQRLEWIVKNIPDFPGAQNLLNGVMTNLGLPTPTAVAQQAVMPSETETVAMPPTATPDYAMAEQLFLTATQQTSDQKWPEALASITELRSKYYDYKTAEVDSMYYLTLRNDGILKIRTGQLEQGIWELNEAGQLGALDSQAAGEIAYANEYINAASYWDSDWNEVITRFTALSQSYPYLADATGMTTVERLRIAYTKVAKTFVYAQDWCTAVSYYDKSLALGADAQVSADREAANYQCNNPTPMPTAVPAEPLPGEATPVVPTEPTPDAPTPTTAAEQAQPTETP